jgi:hypothetical protein
MHWLDLNLKKKHTHTFLYQQYFDTQVCLYQIDPRTNGYAQNDYTAHLILSQISLERGTQPFQYSFITPYDLLLQNTYNCTKMVTWLWNAMQSVQNVTEN